MNLVIVESPTKAKTISGFLDKKKHRVESSYGHIRDLPKSKLGIDVENGFEPQYVIPRKNQKRVTELKKLAAKADRVILATDEDREGEAIAWHLSEALNVAGADRIVFHEITKGAIAEALASPRKIDRHLVDAQQARRVLDRLVGYKLSPFLWKKVVRGLSAGRVQSVALRLIVDREEEILGFKPQEYWTIEADLLGAKGELRAELYRIGDKNLEKLGIGSEKRAKEIERDLAASAFSIQALERKEVKKNPLPPFTTSTLQQTAAQRFGYSAQKTMYLAQQLYENGHITYMRTDSVNLSRESLDAAGNWIRGNLGEKYASASPRVFKGKSRLAQEAHEAIRPTHPDASADKLSGDKLEAGHRKLYDLIWRRFLASQLPEAKFDSIRANISASKGYGLKANGLLLKFDGFLKIWPMKFEERELPPLAEGEELKLKEIVPSQHFTDPPPRYNEASLIRTLEKHGIGRPSTYAPIIYVIQQRNYVEKNQGRFCPTEIGTLVTKVLKENFTEILDIEFTAKMEEELDLIAEGKSDWRKIIGGFYEPFSKHLAEKYVEVSKQELTEEKTDEVCEKCGKPMIIKLGRFGKFLACSGFPDCKTTKTLKDPPKPTGIACPKCLASPDPAKQDNPGELIERRVSKRGRARGKIFWGCNRYPECDFATWTDPLKVPPVWPAPPKPERGEPAPSSEKKPRRAKKATPDDDPEGENKE